MNQRGANMPPSRGPIIRSDVSGAIGLGLGRGKGGKVSKLIDIHALYEYLPQTG